MPGPEFVRRDPQTGAGVFRLEDGSELPVALEDSPTASAMAADAEIHRRRAAYYEPAAQAPPVQIPAEWFQPEHTPEEELAQIPPEWLQPAHAPDEPVRIPPGWLQQTHVAPPEPQGFSASVRDLMAADAALRQQPQQAPRARAIGGALEPGAVTMSPPSQDTQAPRAPSATVTDYTGGAGNAGTATPNARPGHSARGTAPQGPPTLDQLMVPNGVASPGLYGAMIDDMAGGPSGLREQERLAGWGTDIAAQRAAIAQQAATDARNAIDEGERRRIELEQDRQTAMAQARDRYDRALQRVNAMQVDPGRFFRSAGGFGTVGAALAVGLGAIGSALSGTEGNSVLPIIQGAIDRDLEAQRADMAHARQGLEGEFNLLGQMSREFESREAAEQAARAAMLQQAEARAQELLAGVANDEVQMNGQALVGQLRQQWQSAQAAAVQAEQDHQMRRALQMAQLRRRNAEATRAERRAMGGGQRRPVTTAQLEAYERMRSQNIDDAPARRLAGLPEDFPLTGQAALNTEQRSALDALDSSLRGIEQTLPLQGDDIPGIGTFDGRLPDFLVGEQGRSLRQQLENTVDLLGRLRSGAAISAEEEQRFARIIGSSGTEEQLRRGLAMIRAELDNRLGRAGRIGSRSSELDAASAGGRVVE